MALPELDMTRVQRWCAERVPDRARHQVRVECEIAPRHLTVVERRAPWRADVGPEWTSFPIARLRYTAATTSWTLLWRACSHASGSSTCPSRWLRSRRSRPRGGNVAPVVVAADRHLGPGSNSVTSPSWDHHIRIDRRKVHGSALHFSERGCRLLAEQHLLSERW